MDNHQSSLLLVTKFGVKTDETALMLKILHELKNCIETSKLHNGLDVVKDEVFTDICALTPSPPLVIKVLS